MAKGDGTIGTEIIEPERSGETLVVDVAVGVTERVGVVEGEIHLVDVGGGVGNARALFFIEKFKACIGSSSSSSLLIISFFNAGGVKEYSCLLDDNGCFDTSECRLGTGDVCFNESV